MPASALDEKVVRLLSDLEALRRAYLLYPPSHPALQPARDRIRARVLALSTEGESATASFGPDELLWNGEAVRQLQRLSELQRRWLHVGRCRLLWLLYDLRLLHGRG